MKVATGDVLALSYAQRRLIVVDGDEAVDAVRRAAGKGAPQRRDLPTPLVIGDGSVLSYAVGGVVSASLSALFEWYRTTSKATDRADLPVLVVSDSQAAKMEFPAGHPQRKVVYVGHPRIPTKYFPVANFHRFMCDSKFAELARLLVSLAATEISIECVQGYDHTGSADLSASEAPGVEIGGSVSATRKSHSRRKNFMMLTPSRPPFVPDDLVWYEAEASWAQIADARLNGGLQEFRLEMAYRDDFGVNASLKSKIAGVGGLQLGGEFTDFEETVWEISGKFSSAVDPAEST